MHHNRFRFNHERSCTSNKPSSLYQTNGHKMKLVHKPLGTALFTQLCNSLQLSSQLVDAPMRSVDTYLAQMNRLGLFNRSIVVGPIVIRRSYGVDGRSDSGEFIQAAVTTDHGTAAVFWDSEDYVELKSSHDFEAEAWSRVRPLRECPPAIRSMVWPHLDSLLVRLIAQCDLTRAS